jgi:hypothetical protein
MLIVHSERGIFCHLAMSAVDLVAKKLHTNILPYLSECKQLKFNLIL